MTQFFLLFFFSLISIISAAPPKYPSNYHYVSFFKDGHKSSYRTSRNAFYNTDDLLIWDDDYQYETDPFENTLKFETSRGHITPDFSDGLAYPDPYLKTGPEASKAAWYLYKKPLFFNDIKHTNALYENQELRRRNGLSGNRLGSLRPKWPSYRYKNYYRHQYNYNSDHYI